MQTLRIKDETVTGETVNEFQLDFAAEKITIAELITARVKSEVAKYQAAVEDYRGLVTPNAMESRLNDRAGKTRQRAKVDVDKQIRLALEAFDKNGFFILFNEEQVESLQQEIFLTPNSKVSFIKLTPLVGG